MANGQGAATLRAVWSRKAEYIVVNMKVPDEVSDKSTESCSPWHRACRIEDSDSSLKFWDSDRGRARAVLRRRMVNWWSKKWSIQV